MSLRYAATGAAAICAVALLCATAYLYLNLFALPATPVLLSGDQTYFWMDAQKMISGELPYRDFFQFTPPGTDVVYLALFRFFGPRIWVTNAVVLALGIALCWICFSVARQLTGLWTALLAVALFLTATYGKLLNATHHWFSLLLIMCAVRVAMNNVGGHRIAAAGILLGMAAFFTQTHAAVGLIAFFVLLILQSRRERQPNRALVQPLVLLVVCFLTTAVICECYFLFAAGIRQVWYYQFTFVRRYMVHGIESGFLGLPETRFPQALQYLVVYALLLIAYPLSLWRCWRLKHSHDQRLWANLTLLSVLGTLLAIEVAFSLNWLRVFAVSMPAFVLAGFWLERSGRVVGWTTKCAAAVVLVLALLQAWTRQHRQYVEADLPSGRVAVTPEKYGEFDWIRQRTHPGDYFFEALVPTAYLPLKLQSPAFAEGLTRLPQTRPEFVQRTIQELEAKPTQYILWAHYLDEPQPDAKMADPLPPFREYLQGRYRRVNTFTNGDEIWQRK